MKIVAVLAVQWGYPGDKVTRWFKMNPYNHSGKRLINIVGHRSFVATNACADIVYSASDQGTPDAAWLRNNLNALQPTVVLVCGKVANATFKRDMVSADAKIISLPHPAARTWTKKMIKQWARRVQTYTNR